MKDIQGLELYSYDEIIDLVKEFIYSTLEENGYFEDDVEILDIQLHGSRLRGQARDDSDLDVVIEYSGDIDEDDLFNMLHEDPLYIDDIEVDINPLNTEENDMDVYMKKSAEYDKKKLLEMYNNRVSNKRKYK